MWKPGCSRDRAPGPEDLNVSRGWAKQWDNLAAPTLARSLQVPYSSPLSQLGCGVGLVVAEEWGRPGLQSKVETKQEGPGRAVCTNPGLLGWRRGGMGSARISRLPRPGSHVGETRSWGDGARGLARLGVLTILEVAGAVSAGTCSQAWAFRTCRVVIGVVVGVLIGVVRVVAHHAVHVHAVSGRRFRASGPLPVPPGYQRARSQPVGPRRRVASLEPVAGDGPGRWLRLQRSSSALAPPRCGCCGAAGIACAPAGRWRWRPRGGG